MNILDFSVKMFVTCNSLPTSLSRPKGGEFLSGEELHPVSGMALRLLRTEVIQTSHLRGMRTVFAVHVHVSSFAFQGKHTPNIHVD